jgi:hypothetical protein
MNSRDEVYSLPARDAVLVQDFIHKFNSLTAAPKPRKVAFFPASAAPNYTGQFIHYKAGGNEGLFLQTQRHIWNVGEIIDGGTTATVSAAYDFSAGAQGAPITGDHVNYNATLIFVNGKHNLVYTTASGWNDWSTTASAGNHDNFVGITNHKARLYSWTNNGRAFWYTSTDAVYGTFNSFDLSGIIAGQVYFISTMTNDGGAGPDDYLVVVTMLGEVVVYAGTDPADASAWSLVGVYKIGRPLSRDSFIKFGNELIVLCEDDTYSIPKDFSGKRQATKAATLRAVDQSNSQGVGPPTGGEFFKNLLVFGEGTCLDVQNNFAFSKISVSEKDPLDLDLLDGKNSLSQKERSALIKYKEKLFAVAEDVSTSGSFAIYELFTSSPTFKGGRIITQPIPTSGRTNISLVNPVFHVRPKSSAGSSDITKGGIKYRVATVYDKAGDRPTIQASASAWLTVSTSLDSEGLWTPAFGTGNNAQFHIEVLSATCSGELTLERIDFTVSDTGGI